MKTHQLILTQEEVIVIKDALRDARANHWNHIQDHNQHHNEFAMKRGRQLDALVEQFKDMAAKP